MSDARSARASGGSVHYAAVRPAATRPDRLACRPGAHRQSLHGHLWSLGSDHHSTVRTTQTKEAQRSEEKPHGAVAHHRASSAASAAADRPEHARRTVASTDVHRSVAFYASLSAEYAYTDALPSATTGLSRVSVYFERCLCRFFLFHRFSVIIFVVKMT